MEKEAFYFSHDYNARADDKIVALRMKHGWEGYGLFWAIVEKLREQSNYMSVCDYNLIAYDLRSDAAKIKSIINDFGLFAFAENGKCFYSERLKRSMDEKESKSEKARDSINQRWKKNKNNTNVLPSNYEGNTIKESKVKEKKEEEDVIKNWEYEKKAFLKNQQWQYQFCGNKQIELIALETLMKTFIADIELKQDFKQAKELRNHFTNYFNLMQKEKFKTSPFKNEQRAGAAPLKQASDYLNS